MNVSTNEDRMSHFYFTFDLKLTTYQGLLICLALVSGTAFCVSFKYSYFFKKEIFSGDKTRCMYYEVKRGIKSCCIDYVFVTEG